LALMTETAGLLGSVRAAVREGRAPGVEVRRGLAELTDPALVRQAGRILTGLTARAGADRTRTDPTGTDPAGTDPAGAGLRPVRIAALATFTLGSFPYLLTARLVGAGMLPTIEPGDYGAFELSLASASFAEGGDPDLVACLLDDTFFLPADWDAADTDSIGKHLGARLEELRALVAASLERTSATLVLHTVPLPAEVRDTVISLRGRAALAQAWYGMNAGLLALAEQHAQVVVVDLIGELADAAVAARDPRLHRYADMPYTDGALLALADQVRRVAQARAGASRKVLALDLDNTLWGGVLGEVGAQAVQLGGLYPGNAYTELQRAARRLREQGVVLVLVSKNDPEPVEEALAEHPEMLLRAEAFSVRAVSWSAKAEGLRGAAETLALSTDSFVFMDDSDFERGHVAAELPEVAVVSADGDPAHLVRSLVRPGWFDVLQLTETDRERPRLYQSRAMRAEFSGGFASSEDYLRALDVELLAEPVTGYTVARVAQLAARTNQFNLTGVRFDEAATAAMSADPGHLVAAFSVSDRFGAEGIVGAAWVERRPRAWRVLNFVLSCRVLGRGVELAAVGWLVRQARSGGAEQLHASFVPSAKNSVSADFWPRAGFAPGPDGTFTFALAEAVDPSPAWVRLRERSDPR
jgi:FkbH-like protein